MTTKTKKFEDELKELETIVSQIDSGEVERKVELLTRSAGGELRTAPFEPSSDNENDNPAGAKDDDETPF